MPRWPERPVLHAALLLTLGALPAQAPPIADFRTGDGSRFVLVPTSGAALVQWVIATPASSSDEPQGMNSLNLANAMASLRGTWTTGSRNAEAEAKALDELDAALAAQFAARGGPEAMRGKAEENLLRARAAAAVLCDPLAFRRKLAGAPAADVTVQIAPGTLLFCCTTTIAGVERVADLLVERREQCALRGLDAEYEALQAAAIARWDADPMSPLRDEALALAFAGHPLAHIATRPGTAVPDRDLAEATWRRTQRPDRSVHVLCGNFDPAQVRPVLERAFAATALRDAAPPAVPPPPAPRAIRHSTVPGGNDAGCAVGWRLSGREDADVLAAAARWLGAGESAWLQRQLRARGRAGAEVVCRAHWPDPSGPGLFLIEVRQPGDAAGLADLVLKLFAEAAKTAPDGDLAAAMQREALRQRAREFENPMQRAQRLATQLLLHPDLQVPRPLPAPVAPKAISELLGSLQQTLPVVVERGRS